MSALARIHEQFNETSARTAALKKLIALREAAKLDTARLRDLYRQVHAQKEAARRKATRRQLRSSLRHGR